jgi:hyperosmotically inducible protein
MPGVFRRLIGLLAIMLLLAVPGIAQQSQPTTQPAQAPVSGNLQAEGANNALSPEAQDKLVREVRHELIMLPYYNVFDNLSFKVDGRTVVLEGQVTRPVLKSDAGNVVKRIEGVDKVINNIEVLPPSPADDRIRRAAFQSIYGFGPLRKYANRAVPPIHIIVRNGRITLEGVVISEGDRNMAYTRARLVRGTFGVTNNLRVVPGS